MATATRKKKAAKKKTTSRRPKYIAKKGAMFNSEQAQILGDVIDSVFGGDVTPEQLVEYARPRTSPIHAMFEWDDSAAAEKYRFWQARSHINHVVVRFSGGDIRAYHSVRVTRSDDSEERTYLRGDIVKRSPAAAAQVVEKAKAEIKSWRDKYASYKLYFASIMDEIDKLV